MTRDMGIKKNIETDSNEALDIMNLIREALMTDESGADGLPTGVMIELPDGQVVPVSYAWYDRQRDMVRLSYDYDEDEEE